MYGIIYYAHNLVSLKDYVGQSWKSLTERKQYHHSDAINNIYDSYFMRALRKYNKTDWEWKILGYANCQFGLNALEKSWIWIKDSMSPNGYNTREGGSNGKLTKETKQKIRESLTGRKASEEAKQNMSEAQKGKKKAKEHCKNISEALKGRKRTEETKQKIRESLTGIKLTKEHRKNISEARKGMTFSEEHRKNISKALKGIVFTKERCKNISKAKKKSA